MKSSNSLHRKYVIGRFLTYFALIVGSLIMIFPFVWMLLTRDRKSTRLNSSH